MHLFGNTFEENLIYLGLIGYTFIDAYRSWPDKTLWDKIWAVLSNIWAVALVFIPEIYEEGGWNEFWTIVYTIIWLFIGWGLHRLTHRKQTVTTTTVEGAIVLTHGQLFTLLTGVAVVASLFGLAVQV